MYNKAYATKIRRFIMKREAVKRLGGRCKKCGWSGSLAGFHFHHRNPEEKLFTVGKVSTSWERFWNEIQKCDLLCSICHDTLHCDYNDEQFLIDVEKYKGRDLVESSLPWKNQNHEPVLHKIICNKCKHEFTSKSKKQKFCSMECYNTFKRKVERPSKDELKELTKTLSMVKIGKMFGVSNNTVKKWIISYKL